MLKAEIRSQHPVYLDMSFECHRGELLALVGPSGSGKTSALRSLAGLLPLQEGKIQIEDQVWFDAKQKIFVPASQRSVGMVFQNYALFPHLTTYENICLALPSQQSLEMVEDLMRDMGLLDLRKRFPHELSGGQRQRVALARAFARNPKLLLLDEAFSAVDHPTRKILYEELIKLRQRIDIPMVMVTHDLKEARLLCDRMCILDQGKTWQQASPAHIFSSPRNARVAELVGLTDIYSGTFFKEEKSKAVLQWGQGVNSVRLKIEDKGRLPDNTEVKWVISGEYVELLRDSEDRLNCIGAKVTQILQLGDISSVTLDLDLPFKEMMHLELSTRMVKDFQLQNSDCLYISLDPAGIHIMPVYSDPSVKMAQKIKREKKVHIGAVVLVAGQGLRLGSIPKSLMKIGGKTLLERHIDALSQFVTSPVILVTGYYEDQIRSSLKMSNVHMVTNPDPARGQSSSVRLGLETLYQEIQNVDIILMMLGDQPYLDGSDIRQLIEQFKVMSSGDFLLPMVNGQRGNPVLLSGKVLREIIKMNDQMTVREFMDMHPDRVTPWESSNHHFTFDIDSVEDQIDFQNKTGLQIELPYQHPQ